MEIMYKVLENGNTVRQVVRKGYGVFFISRGTEKTGCTKLYKTLPRLHLAAFCAVLVATQETCH